MRRSRCKVYINPFMRFVDQGRRFICNLCGEWGARYFAIIVVRVMKGVVSRAGARDVSL